MKKLNAIIGKEWAGFLGSERGVFSVYGILVLSWSFLPLYKGLGTGPIWWLFFRWSSAETLPIRFLCPSV